MNIPGFQNAEEPGTASIQARIEAAVELQKAGISIAVHFDPVVMIENNLDKYISLADMIFSSLDCSKIAWISMGGFRHTLSLTQTIVERFPGSSLLRGEMFPSDSDNKLRYLASVRRNYYTALINKISEYFKGVPPLYMCMEKPFMWDDLKMNAQPPVF